MILHLLSTVLAEVGSVALKLVDDDRFLGAVDNKLVLTDYRNALWVKLNPMEDVSMKNLVTKDGQALSERRSLSWFKFKWGYKLKKNKRKGSQSFRIVYYAPNEYILMRYDRCLGFKERELTRVECREEKVARFRICETEMCDNYSETYRELKCLKRYLKNQMEGGGWGGRGPRGYRNRHRHRGGGHPRRYDDDESYPHHSHYGRGRGGGESDSDDGYNQMCGPDSSSRRRGYDYGDRGYDREPCDDSMPYNTDYSKYGRYPSSNNRSSANDAAMQLCQAIVRSSGGGLGCNTNGGGLGSVLSGNHLLSGFRM